MRAIGTKRLYTCRAKAILVVVLINPPAHGTSPSKHELRIRKVNEGRSSFHTPISNTAENEWLIKVCELLNDIKIIEVIGPRAGNKIDIISTNGA